jgi:hypothetical protein
MKQSCSNVAANKKHLAPWELDNPSSRDGVYYDKIHATFEIRQFGKANLPLSGKEFYNPVNGMVEVYDDILKPPVKSFRRD